MKKLSIKAILSIVLVLVFLALAFTGALLYFGKTGVVLGVSRHVLRQVHFWVAASMCTLVPVHLLLNLRTLRTELRTLRDNKRDEFGIDERKTDGK